MASFNDDDWDSVVNVESSFVDEGKADGIADAISDGTAFSEGLLAGWTKGLSVGLEVGFYQEIARRLSERGADVASEDARATPSRDMKVEDCAAGTDNHEDLEKEKNNPTLKLATNSSFQRNQKRFADIKKVCDAIPNINSPDVDFEHDVRKLRGLYKLCPDSGSIGDFRQVLSVSKSSGGSSSGGGSNSGSRGRIKPNAAHRSKEIHYHRDDEDDYDGYDDDDGYDDHVHDSSAGSRSAAPTSGLHDW